MKLLALFVLLTSLLSAATFTAATCSNANLQSAINMTSPGDTVVVGSGGTVTWSGNVTISNTQALTLDGTGCTIAGAGGTIGITLGTAGSVRVTGFHTTGAYGGPPYFVNASGSPTSKYLRIDHLTMSDTTTGDTFFNVAGNPTALIDHNTITTGGLAGELIHNFGYGSGDNTGWLDNVTPGSPNQVYIETNTWTNTGSGGFSDKTIESYYGAQTVERYDTFNGDIAVDQHGSVSSISARWWEFYENTWVPGGGPLTGYAALRGGSGVFYNNHQTGSIGSGTPGVHMFDDNSTTYPICYQPGRGIQSAGDACVGSPGGTTTTELLSPMYLWGNDSVIQSAIQGDTAVVLNRDFFVSTNQPATLLRCEQTTDTGTLTSCSTTYTYSAFTYPYPLDANGMPNPAGTPTVATPTFSPVAGTYTTSQSVTISTATGGATICYTTDGSTPLAATPGTCSHGTTYSGAVTVSVSETLMAIGTLTSYTNSAVGSAAYTLQVLTPTFSPVAGSYGSTQMVTISDATMSAVICYTTDGTAPTATSPGTCSHGTTYAGTVTVASSLTLNAIGTLSGWSNSAQGQAIYTITGTGGTLTSGAVCSGGCKIQ